MNEVNDMNILDYIRKLIEIPDPSENRPATDDAVKIDAQEAYDFNYAAALSDLGWPLMF